MTKLAIVENGVVTNVVIGRAEDMPDAIDVSDLSVGPGFSYDGTTFTRPSRKPSPKQKVMDAQTFLNLLTRDELVRLFKSSNETIQDTVILFQMRNGEVNVESQIFAEVIAAAIFDGALTATRAAELSQGIEL